MELKTIPQLKDEFETNYGLYAGNESQTRLSLIDVMLVNLGWDVTDPKMVRVEPPVQTSAGKKKADYILYDDRARPVVVIEAKAPKVRVAQDAKAIFQVLRYGWNLETVSVGVLTDFEEWEVYNTSTKPSKETNRFRIPDLCCTYKEYAEKWDTLSGYFSRAAVLEGRLRAYATTTKVSLPPDEAFLKDLESYRLSIAQALVKNEGLAHDWDLSEYAQRVLDRLLLLRILEDRGYGEWLHRLTRADDPGQHLSDLVSRLQPTYNSRFFERHPVDALRLEPEKIRAVVKELADPDSVYDFSAMPVEIIGKAYEKFLGSQVRITPARRVKIEPKPEVRKAGGVYYTPRYIVDYIVENTLSPLFEGKSASQAAKIKILDPACGSGSFLVGAARWLERWYAEKYARPLTHEDRRTIVLRHLHGVDIDANAVEVTQLSLCLWLLEKAPIQMDMSHAALLPDLSGNIRCGNSLIGSDFYSGDQKDLFEDDAVRRRVNAFDWDGPHGFPEIMKRGGFDAVIGNPPYDVISAREQERPEDEVASEKQYYKTRKHLRPALGNKLNYYRLFVAQSLYLVREGGSHSFIVPMGVLADTYAKPLRVLMLSQFNLVAVEAFPQKDNPYNRVFRFAKLPTCVYVLTRPRSYNETAKFTLRVHPGRYIDPESPLVPLTPGKIRRLAPELLSIPVKQRCTSADVELAVRLGEACVPLSRYAASKQGEVNVTTHKEFVRWYETKPKTVPRGFTEVLRGAYVDRYLVHAPKQGGYYFVDQAGFIGSHQRSDTKAADHKLPRIGYQRGAALDNWRRIIATKLPAGAFCTDTINYIVNAKAVALVFILGILNSALLEWRFRLTSATNHVNSYEIDSLPFPDVDLSRKADKARHDKMVSLVERMLDLHKKLPGTDGAEKKQIEQLIARTDREIDSLVYQLYDLTDEEIKIVEEAVK